MFSVQQEILLFTKNTFCQKQWSEKEITEGSKQLSQIEILAEACWNGLLGELLPEIVKQPGFGRRLFLWEIKQGETSLHIQLSESTVHLDMQDSIDPYFFLNDSLLNN